MPLNNLPRICELDTNLFTPVGYYGRGMTMGTMFGQAMADLLTSKDPAELPLPVADRQIAPNAPIMSRFYQTALAVN